MRRYLILLSFILGGALGSPIAPAWSQSAESRVALVIGNAAYKEAPLKNPVNDARAVAATLRQLGFEVMVGENATKQQMEKAVGEFGRRLTKDSVALFYFAGHGMQVSGRNFLIPTDADISSEQSVRLKSFDIDLVFDQVGAAASGVNLIILDACRNNPFERRFRDRNYGLAQLNAPPGTLIAYSTAPGKVAPDGDEANSLYTSKLIDAIQTPGLSVEQAFKRARVEVGNASNNQQTPWDASSLTRNFSFVSAPAEGTATSASPLLPLPIAASAAPFDGSWTTTIICSKTPDGVGGYTLRFPADIRDGQLSGKYESPNKASSVSLSGVVKSDGTALLYANGTTGDPNLTYGRVKSGTAYAYTASAKFEGSSGSGSRNEARACSLAFTRQ